MSTGAELIAAERERQIAEKGWDADHDDFEHTDCALTAAAEAYIWQATGQCNGICWPEDHPVVPQAWPWEPGYWKPSDDPVRNLAKAGALIAAEIDRLQRKAASDA